MCNSCATLRGNIKYTKSGWKGFRLVRQQGVGIGALTSMAPQRFLLRNRAHFAVCTCTSADIFR